MKKTEPFDCLDYKDRVQEEIQRETAGLPHAQAVDRIRRRAEEGALGEWWKKVRDARRAA